jgi:NitT/TauT family transport system substrate-binding protein
MTFRRGAFLSVSAAATAMTLFPSRPARAADTVRIGVLPIDNTAEVLYAQTLGMFGKAGIDVDIQIFRNGSASAAAMAGGAIDLGSTDAASMAAAHAHGLPLTYIAPATIFTRTNPAYVLLVPLGSPMTSGKDFNGKTLAVSSLRGIVQLPTAAWIDNNGGDSKTVKFVELPFPAMGAAILNGTVDAAAESEPFVTSLVEAGNLRVISVADKNIAPEFMFSGWATTTAWANENVTTVKKLVDVFATAAKWGNANHAQSAQILVAASKMPEDVANKMTRSYYGERLDASLLQPVIDAAAKYGTIAKPFPAAEVFSRYAIS